MSNLFWLSEEQFEKIKPLFPDDVRGVPRVDDRRVLSGIIHMIKRGLHWSDCPAEYGPAKTIYNRYARWGEKGVLARIYAATGTINTSDMREKTAVIQSDLGLDFVKHLNPVRFKWLSETESRGDETYKGTASPLSPQRTHYGLVAQDVKDALEKVRAQDFGGYVMGEDGRLGLRYDQFIAPLIKAVQELAEENQQLQQRIVALEAMPEKLNEIRMLGAPPSQFADSDF